jgi:2-methylisocitrate lyase-like PEP mutase family enzyme
MQTMNARHQAFADLHQSGCFVLPNPWDIGSARMMAALGAKALATTSAGHAFTLGLGDMGQVSREAALIHAATIVSATSLPVSGDLENGYGDDPDTVATTIMLAAEAGLSGCSIEDTDMADGHPAYPFELAVERIRAATSATKQLSRPFMLCARADGVMNGVYDTSEAIRRVQAFEQAGADLVYAPILPDAKAVRKLIASVSVPVNVLAAGWVRNLGVSELAGWGVRRISTGSQIARLTHDAIARSTQAMLADGDFKPLLNAANGSEIDALLHSGA